MSQLKKDSIGYLILETALEKRSSAALCLCLSAKPCPFLYLTGVNNSPESINFLYVAFRKKLYLQKQHDYSYFLAVVFELEDHVKKRLLIEGTPLPEVH